MTKRKNDEISTAETYEELLAAVNATLASLQDSHSIVLSTKRHSPQYKDPPPDLPITDLYNALQDINTTNKTVWLLGPRGSGKSMLTHHALSRLDFNYRLVYLNGILTAASNSNTNATATINPLDRVVQNVLQQLQLSTNALGNTTRVNASNNRRNPLAPLHGILQLAKAEGVPILFVIDEIDQYTALQQKHLSNMNENNNPHALLYFLLDRIATSDSLLSIIGITSVNNWQIKLDKRVLSRSEGTSKAIVLGKSNSSSSDDNNMESWKNVMKYHLQATNSAAFQDQVLQVYNDTSDSIVRQTLQRNFAMGKTAGWQSRVATLAISLYRYDLITSNDTTTTKPFTNDYWWQAFLQTSNTSFIAQTTHQRDLITVESSTTNNKKPLSISSARLEAMQDLCRPHLVILMAIRRIRKRDTQKDTWGALTLSRILAECDGKENLRNACFDLLDTGILKLLQHHTGTLPLQHVNCNVSKLRKLNWNVLFTRPLTCTIDTVRELDLAIELNIVNCPTVLYEWGKRIG